MIHGAANPVLLLLPFLVVAFWLSVSTVLAVLSGWFDLQARYSSSDERAIFTLRGQSGSMGMGVSINGAIRLDACPSGLRVGINRLVAPFQRPFLVPWSEIDIEAASSFLFPAVKLRFGRPDVGSLKIEAIAWQRLADAVPAAPSLPQAARISRSDVARAYLLQWMILSVGAGLFFFVVSHLGRAGPKPIPAIIPIFPAIVFGIAQSVRFVRQAP